MKNPCVIVLSLLVGCGNIVTAATMPLDPAQLAYNLKMTVQAYEKVGRKNPKWDSTARECLEGFARLRSCTNGIPVELSQNLQTNLRAASLTGCDDPLIRYIRIRFLENYEGAESSPIVSEVASALQTSDYPAIRKYYATMLARRTLLRSDDKRQTEADNILIKAASYFATALDDPSMPKREADQGCDALMSASWWSEPTLWQCYQIIEPALTHHWKGTSVALLAKGRAYLSYAWAARGKGYANTVSNEGWRLLEERLNTASEALEAAWRLDPQDARICLEMMRITLGKGAGREQLETWFQRGMKLQPANQDLCYAKIEYLRPRWYGSIAEMIDFGRESTTNTNWSGPVRLMLADAHYEASREIQDAGEQAAYWKQANVWSDIHFTFEQYFKLYPADVGYRHNYARYAVWCGQPQEFLKQVKLFPSTNYSYFGGVDQFNSMVRWAKRAATAQ